MANNRMLIVHKATGRAFVFAKFYPTSNWFSLRDKLDFEKFCDDLPRGDWENGEDFELLYETQIVYVSDVPLVVKRTLEIQK